MASVGEQDEVRPGGTGQFGGRPIQPVNIDLPAPPALSPAFSGEHNETQLNDPHGARGVQQAQPRHAPYQQQQDDPETIVAFASVLADAGQAAQAWDLIGDVAARGYFSPKLAGLCLQVAPALKREPEALGILERTLAEKNINPIDRKALHFRAVRLLDQLGRYDEAFAHARMGRQAVPQPYDPRAMRAWFDRCIAYYTPDKLHCLPRAPERSRRPVFIIGMPRSGTSLLEQILASHPQVHGGGELGFVTQLVLAAADGDPECRGHFPECLDSISLRAAQRIAAQYLAEVSALNSTATYVTDKMPLNFLYIGLIALLFPDCHVIHCVRDPMDTCLSCYLTDFATGHEFTNDLLHLGAMYLDYKRLMDHWTGVLNFPVLQVRYEDVVRDLELQTRRVLEFLDLPWDPRCLRFHENPRRIATASRDQICRPLYATSVGRWRNYQKHLTGLHGMFAQAGVAV